MAANGRFPAWTDDEMEALIERYRAGDFWRDIAPVVSAASGNHRSRDSCRKKAGDLLLTADRERDYNRVIIDQGDLEDVVMLGYSRARAAKELGVAEKTFSKNLEATGNQLLSAWRKHARRRQLEGLQQRHKGKDSCAQ